MMEVPELLSNHQVTIRAADPAGQTIPYEKLHWRRQFAADSDVEYLIMEYPDQLSRGDVAAVAAKACYEMTDRWIRRLLFATMMWGFGTVGYGAYRTSKMLGRDNSLDVTRESLDLVAQGDIVAAYEVLSLPYCGPTFRTKILYFAGLGFELEPLPLVLDSIVTARLSTLLDIGSENWGKADSYLRYVLMMNSWAKELGCRPDCIELFLFSYGGDGS